MNKFMNSTRSERFSIIMSDKDEIHIYELLSKHLRTPIDQLKQSYSITLNTIKRFIEIDSTPPKLFELFQYLSKWGVKFESITMDRLRLNLQEFINKIL